MREQVSKYLVKFSLFKTPLGFMTMRSRLSNLLEFMGGETLRGEGMKLGLGFPDEHIF